MGKYQGPRKWSKPNFSWYGGGQNYCAGYGRSSWADSWHHQRGPKKKAGTYTCCPNPNCRGWAWDDAAYYWCYKCGNAILGRDHDDDDDETDDYDHGDKDGDERMQAADGGADNDNDNDKDEEEEKIDETDKERILEEAMAQLFGKKRAKAMLGAIKEKINAPADEPKTKTKSTERKETLESLQKVTKERDLVKKRLANVEKELEEKKTAMQKLERDKKAFKQRYDEVNERHGKIFDKLTRLRNASSDDDEADQEGDDEHDDDGDGEDMEVQQQEGDDNQADVDLDKDDGNEGEYDDATYDGPKWQTVAPGRRKSSQGKGQKPKNKGSSGANEGTAAARRGTSATGAAAEALRGRLLAHAKAKVKEKQLQQKNHHKHQQQQHQQQQQLCRRQLPTQAGGSLPPIDVVDGKEAESEAIIAEAHRQAAAQINALRASAAAAAAAANGEQA